MGLTLFACASADVYTPWSDIEGRPLWAPSADTLPVSVSTPLIGINATVEGQDTTKCTTHGCGNNAQFKCYFCKKIICPHHHSRMNYFRATIDTCPMCVRKVTNHRILFALFLFAFVAAAVAVSIYLAHHETQ